jgi:ribonuclease HI
LYKSWADCSAQVDGFSGAKYKSFETEAEARAALQAGWQQHVGVPRRFVLPPEVPADSLSVDAACDGSPGNLEYRGLHTGTGNELFHVGPLPNGTNNLGEFMAIVHALAWLKQQGKNWPVCSDSRVALGWVRQKVVRSKLPRTPHSAQVWAMADRALAWLQANAYPNDLIDWDTDRWGEIRADFGRK